VHEFEDIVRSNLGHHLPTTVSAILPQENGSFDLVLDNGSSVRTRAIILSTGARAQRLFVPGELEFWGKGVSYSAISHAPFFAGKKVAVIGSGSRAVNAVLALTQLSSQVYFIVGHGGNLEQSSAWEIALRHPKVLAFHDWEVQQISGDEFANHLVLVGANGEIREIEVEGVFVQFGLLPNNGLVREIVSLDDEGHIVIDAFCNTSVPGIFAAGDVSSVHVEQVPISLGEGAKAAVSAWKYLSARHD
jgi:thioredoxin reductase